MEEPIEEEKKNPLQNVTNSNTSSKNAKNLNSSKGMGGLFSSLKSLVGAKILTKETIAPVMEKMQEHLVGKPLTTIRISLRNMCLVLL